VPCHVCNMLFVNVSRVRAHFMYKHSEIKFDCNLCDYFSPTQNGVKEHCIIVHQKNKKCKCELCYYATSTRGSLKKHVGRVYA
jgi:hypothetical protein